MGQRRQGEGRLRDDEILLAWPAIGLFTVATIAVQIFAFVGLGWNSVYWTLYPHATGPAPALLVLFGLPFLCAMLPISRASNLSIRAHRLVIPAAALSIALALISAFIVQQRLPSSADEYGYLFEANTFLAGRLWNPVPPGREALTSLYVWISGDKWVSQYPPGWPATIALWRSFGLDAWAAGSALLAVALASLYVLVRRQAGVGAAALAVLVFGVVPFTSFNAGSLFSHMFAAALVVSAYAAMPSIGEIRVSRFLLVGCLVGLLGLARSLTAAVALLPIILEVTRRRDWRGLLAIGAGGAPFAAILLWYQWRLTGDPLTPSYYVGGYRNDHLYFGLGAIRTGAMETWKRFVDLGLWTSPALIALWGGGVVTKVRSRNLDYGDFVFPLGMLILLFYPLAAGNKYGPRYYFDFFPMLVYTVCSVRASVDDRLGRRRETLLVLSAIYALILAVPLALGFKQISTERNDLYSQVQARHISNSAVCIARGTGKMLGMPYHDLVRNDVNASGPVLYANCFKTTPRSLARLFPHRQIWIFKGGTVTHGHLARLR